MNDQPQSRWRVYAMEAAGLGGFVLFAGLLSIVLEHPDGPVMNSWLMDFPTLRRVPLGIIMGLYIFIVIKLAGKRSGAHINPSVTWTFYRLGKISFRDAIGYTIAQFAGATAMALLLKAALGRWFGHPAINYGVTAPKPPHDSLGAFTAEAIMTFLMMAITLFSITSRKWESKVAGISGLLIMLYLIVEIPFSGMSLNPARSFAGALAGEQWQHLWIYFVSPVGAALLAAEVFLRFKKRSVDDNYKPLPQYPVPE